MRDIVMVRPANRTSHRHRNCCRREGKIIDLDCCFCGLLFLGRYGAEHYRAAPPPSRLKWRQPPFPGSRLFSSFVLLPSASSVYYALAPKLFQTGIGYAQRVLALNITTSRMPSTLRNCSAGTFIGPGEGAAPGLGCGNAVEPQCGTSRCLPPSAWSGGCGRSAP